MGRGIEVANVFKLGTKFSEAFNVRYVDDKGEQKPVIMGSYGMGPTRVMGALVEEYHDEKGILWPEIVAPFKAHLLVLGDSAEIKKEADKAYKILVGHLGESEVLYDERTASAGEKLNDADLLGAPWRAVVSEKTVAAKKIEVKKRSEKEPKMADEKQLLKLVK